MLDEVVEQYERFRDSENISKNESNTQLGVIEPFIKVLGYDMNSDVDAEYHVGGKTRVDYAILHNDKPMILVECKKIHKNLTKDDFEQLRGYANITSSVKFAILTNGQHFKFYTKHRNNTLRAKPFLIIDLENLPDEHETLIGVFHKDNFTLEGADEHVNRLLKVSKLKKMIKKEMANPSKEFVKYFFKKLSTDNFTDLQYKEYKQLMQMAMNTEASKLKKMIKKEMANPSKEFVKYFFRKLSTDNFTDLQYKEYKQLMQMATNIIDIE